MADLEAKTRKALEEALGSAGVTIDDADVVEYLAGIAAGILEDGDASDAVAAAAEIREALEAQLEEAGASDAAITAVCTAIAKVKFPSEKAAPKAKASAKKAAGGPASNGSKGGAEPEGELLCNMPDLLLMYGGSAKPLLKNTSFELRRLHRYGIVGHNGAGKTTLFSALISGAVKELSDSLSLVHVHGGDVADFDDDDRTALDFAGEKRLAAGNTGPLPAAALDGVGFTKEMQRTALGQLSGGWRMRLVLACAMMRRADVLLLDEPTNHLDTEAVKWLGEYLQGFTGTSLIISHEPEFLNKTCTDIIHFDDQKLKYYTGNFAAFQEQASIHGDEADAVLETKSWAAAAKAIQGSRSETKISFPIPGKLDGVTTQTKPILEVKGCSFAYTGPDRPIILRDVTCKLSLGSRIAVVGANGAGKSTLLSLMCGETAPTEREEEGVKLGEVVRHRNMRLSYIAQHHTFHLEEFLKCTPVHYFQLRFKNGYDEQLQIRLKDPGTEEEQKKRAEMASKLGKYGKAVREIVGRQKRGKDILYEVSWEGLDDAKQNTWEPMSKLNAMLVDGYARAYDERLAAQAAATHERPLTDREIIKHMENFCYTEDMTCRQMISSFSAGQKARLMLGAAFWTKPHVIALDEPTNYLDPETVDALARALNFFRGGVIAVTHSQHFIDEVCNEQWLIADQRLSSSKMKPAPQLAAPKPEVGAGPAVAADAEPAGAAEAPVSAAAAAAARAAKPSAKKKR